MTTMWRQVSPCPDWCTDHHEDPADAAYPTFGGHTAMSWHRATPARLGGLSVHVERTDLGDGTTDMTIRVEHPPSSLGLPEVGLSPLQALWLARHLTKAVRALEGGDES